MAYSVVLPGGQVPQTSPLALPTHPSSSRDVCLKCGYLGSSSTLPLTPRRLNKSLGFLVCRMGVTIQPSSEGCHGDCREFLVWKSSSPASSPGVGALRGSSYPMGEGQVYRLFSRGSCSKRKWFLALRLGSNCPESAGGCSGPQAPFLSSPLPLPVRFLSQPSWAQSPRQGQLCSPAVSMETRQASWGGRRGVGRGPLGPARE